MNGRLFVGALGLGVLMGCLTTAEKQYIDDTYSVDVTSNPDTVKSCKRLGGVGLVGYTGKTAVTMAGPGLDQTRLEYLRFKASEIGADTLFTVNNEIGVAYLCKAAPVPTPPR